MASGAVLNLGALCILACLPHSLCWGPAPCPVGCFRNSPPLYPQDSGGTPTAPPQSCDDQKILLTLPQKCLLGGKITPG